MLAEIGQITLILAFIMAVFQAGLPLVGSYRRDGRLMSMGAQAARMSFLFVFLAYALLTTLFVVSDFTVRLVYAHSHTAKPLLYKISGVWGNHEGSMLLWILILTGLGAAITSMGRGLPETLRSRAVGVQGCLSVGFLAFLVFTSNPFERLSPIPENGRGLNPLLQDPGLAFHPPFLYLGYVGFSIAFAFAVAALIEGRVDSAWARWVRPWVILAWSFLTIGIMLGSVWAYYELGWGGWWFWDPVENVSFMPWLAGTALLHSVLVVEKRHTLLHWTLLLAIATFSLSLVGTFIVRSGVLTSVHAFAVDPERGVFILGLILFYTGGALTLYALRANSLLRGASFKAVSREGGLVINNLLLVTAAATVFLGTFYPLIIDALTGSKLTVGPPYFNLTFLPIMSLLIVFMGIGPLLWWREDSLMRLKPILIWLVPISVALFVAVWILGKSVVGSLGVALSAYLACGAIATYLEKIRFRSVPFSKSFQLWRNLPAATHGFGLAHLGLAITALGITGMSVWATEDVARLQPGETMSISGYTLRMEDVRVENIANYQAQRAFFSVIKNGQPRAELISERRFYPVEQQMTTEAAMDVSPARIVFITLGEGDEKTGWQVHAYWHPLVIWIWLGAVVMAAGGLISVADRRYGFLGQPAKAAPNAIPAQAE